MVDEALRRACDAFGGIGEAADRAGEIQNEFSLGDVDAEMDAGRE